MTSPRSSDGSGRRTARPRGDDAIILRYIAAQVDGAMVIAPALFPEAFQEVWRLFRGGTRRRAADRGERMLPFLHVFGIGDEIPATKALLGGYRRVRLR